MKKILQNMFSVKNSENKLHKIVTVLGLKIKIKRRVAKTFDCKPINKDELWLKQNAMERMDANRDDFFDKTRCFFHTDRYRFACEFTEGKNVIDCAAGTGYGANILKMLGRAKSVVGAEINKDAVKYAQKNYGSNEVTFVEGSILELPFEDNSFDVFTSFETLEHIDNEDKQFSEVKRVLKDGGLYILSTPNDWKSDVTNPHHVRQYDYAKLKNVLSRNFEVLKIYNQNSGTPNRIENKEQPRSIYLTIGEGNGENHALAECFIAVCRIRK